MWLYALTIIYSVVIGYTEALMWGRKGAESFKHNEHIGLILNRNFIFLALIICLYVPITIYDIFGSGLLLISLHPSFYYYFRNKIDGSYPKGVLSNPSSTSTATINLSLVTRLLILSVSIVCFILTYI